LGGAAAAFVPGKNFCFGFDGGVWVAIFLPKLGGSIGRVRRLRVVLLKARVLFWPNLRVGVLLCSDLVALVLVVDSGVLVDMFWFYAGRCGVRCLVTGFGLGGYVLVWTWLGWIWWIWFGLDGSAGFSPCFGGSLGDGFGWCATGGFSALRRTVVWFLWLLEQVVLCLKMGCGG
jgi:hypothetical protein